MLKLPLLFLPFFLSLFVFIIQQNLIPNIDFSYHLETASKMLSRQKLYSDIIQVNTPNIYYFMLIPAWISKIFGLDLLTIGRTFALFILSLQIFLSGLLLRKHFNFWQLLIIMLLLCFLILFYPYLVTSSHLFAEKEHFFYAILIPFLILIWGEHKKVSIILKIIIGLFAGFAFSIKPFFLFPLLVILLLLAINKGIKALLNTEILIILLMQLMTYINIYFFSEHLQNPAQQFILKTYLFIGSGLYRMNDFIQIMIFFHGLTLLSLPIAFYLAFMHKIKILSNLSFLVIACLISGLIQLKYWWYHLLPYYALNSCLIALLIYYFFKLKLYKSCLVFLILPYLLLAIYPYAKLSFSFNDKKRLNILLDTYEAKQFKEFHNKKVMFFDENVHPAYQYNHIYRWENTLPVVSLQSFTGLINLIALSQKNPKYTKILKTRTQELSFLIEAIAKNIQRYRPELIFIHINNEKVRNRYKTPQARMRIDYLKYLNNSELFQKLWKNYTKIKIINYKGRTYDVYATSENKFCKKATTVF